MQSNGPLSIRLPRRRKARHNGPRLVSSNRQSQVPRRVTWCRRDTGTMSLSFPNQSRSYDATLRAVRFWGHDGAMEVAFFVNEDALKRIEPSMRSDETGLLNAFDSHRGLIYAAATKVYRRSRKGSYELTAADL